MSYQEDNKQSGRIIMPDLVRAFALFGIVLVNVAYFAYPGEVTYHAGGLNSQLDNAAFFGVNAFFSIQVIHIIFIYVWCWSCVSNGIS